MTVPSSIDSSWHNLCVGVQKLLPANQKLELSGNRAVDIKTVQQTLKNIITSPAATAEQAEQRRVAAEKLEKQFTEFVAQLPAEKTERSSKKAAKKKKVAEVSTPPSPAPVQASALFKGIMPQANASGLDMIKQHLPLEAMVQIGAGIVGNSPRSNDYTKLNEFLLLVPKEMRRRVVLGVMIANPLLINHMLRHYHGDIDAIPPTMKALLQDKNLQSQLHVLDLRHLSLSNEKLMKILALFPNTQELNLQQYGDPEHDDSNPFTTKELMQERVGGDSMLFIAENLKKLTHLTLSSCLTNVEAAHIATLPRLTHLTIDACDNAAVPAIATMQQLTHLTLEGNSLISDASVLEIAQKLKQLTYLDLSWCTKLTDTAAKAIATMKQLTYLDLRNCDKLTDDMKRQLREVFPDTTTHLF